MENNNADSEKSFDETYAKKVEMFGHPYLEFQDYFNKYPVKGTVLDLGCGQGRDSLFLASMGYQVTAVDSSKVGVNQMLEKAKKQNLTLIGIAEDIFNLKIEANFDIILFDMLLHGFDNKQQTVLLEKYSKHLNNNGIICIVYPDDIDKNQFIDQFNLLQGKWQFIQEIDVKDVPKIDGETIDFEFRMMIVKYISK
jgi:tellurite methyltransferase